MILANNFQTVRSLFKLQWNIYRFVFLLSLLETITPLNKIFGRIEVGKFESKMTIEEHRMLFSINIYSINFSAESKQNENENIKH